MKFLLSIPSLLSLLAAMTVAPTSFAQQQRGGRDYRERSEGLGIALPVRQGEGVQESALHGGEFAALAAPPQRAGRMTPEERRQLRRDIDDAGREIYRHRHGGRP